MLAAACTKEVYKKGEVISSGVGGTAEFFVVKRGEASVWMGHPCCPSPTGVVVPPTPVTPPARTERRSVRTSVLSASNSIGGGSSVTASSDLAPKGSVELCLQGQEPRRGRTSVRSARSLTSSIGGAVKVATLRTKDYFGESALMGGENWDFSIVVESQELEVIKITKDNFDKLHLSARLRIPKRERVYLSATAAQTNGPSPAESTKRREKDEGDRAWIRQTLLSRVALNEFFEQHDGILEKLVDVAWRQDLSEGHVLIKPSANPGPLIYMVQDGTLLASHRKDLIPGTDLSSPVGTARRTSFFCSEMEQRLSDVADGDHISTSSGSTIGPGSCYGECTLMYDTAHVAQVKTIMKTSLWVIDQTDLAEATRAAHNAKLEKYIEYLEHIPLFASLLSDEKMTIAKTLVEQTWTCGQELYRQGEINQTLIILLDGEVVVVRDDNEEKRLLVDSGHVSNNYPVRHFGEQSLTEPVAAQATIRVTSTNAMTLALAREVFEVLNVSCLFRELHGDGGTGVVTTEKGEKTAHPVPYRSQGSSPSRLSDRLSKITNGSATLSAGDLRGGPQPWSVKQSRVRREHLKKLALLGRGGFGIVELCEDVFTKAYYALKTVKKARVAKTEFLKTQILNEKYILEMTGSRFIIKLFGTDRSDQDLYFILEPALGGELLATYRSKKLFGEEVYARYYAASVICAFEHLHERYILYRDLKPENLMLDYRGRLKLTDMGLAKFVVGRTFTVCGTPVYFAPEVAKQSGYNCAVDWWQLGILVWELLTGRTPFPANTRGEAFYWLFQEKALMTLDQPAYTWPSKIPDSTKDFLKALLQYDPTMRVPMMPNGLNVLRENSWYKDFQWQELQQGKMEAPYQPPKWDPHDDTPNENFFVNDLIVQKDLVYTDDGTNWDADF